MERGYAGGPHAAARTAVVWEVLRREIDRASASRPRLTVVDVGGGTGGFAVPLAQAGHHVTVVDVSPDALAALTRRAEEAGVGGSVHAVQGDADALADLARSGLLPRDGADIVLCHSVLEVVDSPAAVVAALAAALRPGGAASVLVANRAAAALARAISGQLDLAAALLTDPAGRFGPRDTLRRRFDPESAAALLTNAGLAVEEIHGVRVVADLVAGAVVERDSDALASFEWLVAARLPFRDIASQLHLLARKS